MDQIHRLILRGLVKRVYEQPLINNVERGAYIEHMIELALGEQWCLTWPWAPWDLQHEETLARIEIKQSAARQPWHRRRPPESPATRGSFGINKASEVYYLADGTECRTPLQRHADLYVFAWHPENGWDSADHRRPNQWKFFVAAESNLPKPPEPKAMTIGIKKLEKLSGVESGGYDELAAMVAKVLVSLGRLKADDCRETS